MSVLGGKLNFQDFQKYTLSWVVEYVVMRFSIYIYIKYLLTSINKIGEEFFHFF